MMVVWLAKVGLEWVFVASDNQRVRTNEASDRLDMRPNDQHERMPSTGERLQHGLAEHEVADGVGM